MINYTYKILVIIIPIIIVGYLGYYIGTTYSPSSPYKMNISKPNQDEVIKLLKELNEVMKDPHANVDTVNNFLLEKYGPCWGIPESRCRE